MNSLLPLLHVIGVIVGILAMTMFVPVAFEWGAGDGALGSFLKAMLLTAASGLGLYLATRRYRRELRPRDGFLLVTLVWTVLPAFATLPLMFQLPAMSFTDAYFETVSGLTTTGVARGSIFRYPCDFT